MLLENFLCWSNIEQTIWLHHMDSWFTNVGSLLAFLCVEVNNFNTNILSGQAVGGIFPALVDVFVTLVRVREQDVGFACFTIATVVLVIGILGKSSPSFQKFAF